ncbi:class I SAM-dependent methyltransferase [Amycolatopsis cihanbeyliensis]|uniref:Methyltransferase family protein n=1 Tax=Amycolatopsis cihanbeyliensis TaxID=1128664 RepID=A0A542DLW2_AMYCI|nr:class I SAM-dependent methyltransferase [Amycolatopsis cihanbeyliensis]TQJ04086.1 hypothetical protein FB471_3867 [Amycolatopsis cihanbeyliensis]
MSGWGRPPTAANRKYRENARLLEAMDEKGRFTHIFRTNLWSGDSVSGTGSDGDQTRVLRAELPAMMRRVGIRTLLDLPCGDFNWLADTELDLDWYLGADIVDELILRNERRHARVDGSRRFVPLDLLRDTLPGADGVLCRDCLVHFGFADIRRALANVRASGSRYLITTTFTELTTNVDISTGDWRPLNLCREPFGFPEPVDLILEGCTEENGAYADKALAVWDLGELPAGG